MDFNRKKAFLLSEVNNQTEMLSENNYRIEQIDREIEKLKKERVRVIERCEDLTFRLEIIEKTLADAIIKGS